MTIQDQADGSRRPGRPQAADRAAVASLADSQDITGVWFPRLAARDLDGREVALPAGLPGEWTVVIMAFRREHQDSVDSWVPWLQQRAAADPRLGFVELPVIGPPWWPARPVIHGGFGPWVCRMAPSNVRAVSLTGPYRWHRAIGPRLSLADHGLTFGATTTRGVCLQLRDPVPGIDPIGLIRHPNLTLTVADPQRFAAVLRHYMGKAPGHTALAQDGE